MRVLVLGGGGMLGRDLQAARSEHDVTVLGREEADVTLPESLSLALRIHRPDVVINCAAATDVDKCEREPEWATAVNGTGAGNVARACVSAGVRLVHVSTDFVFSGADDRMYGESDPTDPVNEYGRSKWVGEQQVREAAPQSLMVRTQWLFGSHGKSFPAAILGAARRNPETPLRIVCDQWGAPTFTGHLAGALMALVETPCSGLLHLAATGECTRFEWAQELFSQAGVTTPLVPISAAEWPAPAPRPRRTTLRSERLDALGISPLPSWQSGVRDYLKELGLGPKG